eukprot:COSAG01_NODE_6081_length_3863_cov_56.781615_3_plen_77_part_00
MQSTVKEMQATIDKAVADKKTAVANCKCQPSMLTEQHLKIATCVCCYIELLPFGTVLVLTRCSCFVADAKVMAECH